MAIAAAVNLGLVLFDLSYVPWRDFYQRNFPALNHLNIPGFTLIPSLPYGYDSIKGIEPHRETQNYLLTVNALKQQVTQTGLQSPQSTALPVSYTHLTLPTIYSV